MLRSKPSDLKDLFVIFFYFSDNFRRNIMQFEGVYFFLPLTRIRVRDRDVLRRLRQLYLRRLHRPHPDPPDVLLNPPHVVRVFFNHLFEQQPFVLNRLILLTPPPVVRDDEVVEGVQVRLYLCVGQASRGRPVHPYIDIKKYITSPLDQTFKLSKIYFVILGKSNFGFQPQSLRASSSRIFCGHVSDIFCRTGSTLYLILNCGMCFLIDSAIYDGQNVML